MVRDIDRGLIEGKGKKRRIFDWISILLNNDLLFPSQKI